MGLQVSFPSSTVVGGARGSSGFIPVFGCCWWGPRVSFPSSAAVGGARWSSDFVLVFDCCSRGLRVLGFHSRLRLLLVGPAGPLFLFLFFLPFAFVIFSLVFFLFYSSHTLFLSLFSLFILYFLFLHSFVLNQQKLIRQNLKMSRPSSPSPDDTPADPRIPFIFSIDRASGRQNSHGLAFGTKVPILWSLRDHVCSSIGPVSLLNLLLRFSGDDHLSS